MSQDYERKLEEFIEGRTFMRLFRPVRDRADGQCDACGSLEPRILFGLKEAETDRCFFVGAECLKRISQRGVVQRRYFRDNSQVAFEQEMAKRRSDEGTVANANIAQPLQEIKRLDMIPNRDGNGASHQPEVFLWETPESYLALVAISHRGTWVWGSAEAARFESMWAGSGNGVVVLEQVHRERSQAVAECARAAIEDALTRVKELKDKQQRMFAPSGNGHHDWTGFWTTVRGWGIEREEVAALIDGCTPRDWLGEHPECSLEDLLKIVQEKREAKIAISSSGSSANTEQA